MMNEINLTSFARMGGCSCKLGVGDLDTLRSLPEVRAAVLPNQTSDDAAILPIGGGQALVTSIDFQNIIVDDGVLAGEIAAKNALSDIFACGVSPMYADVVLVVPYGDHALETGKDLMRGVARACQDDGCFIVGGHTIQGEMPIVGLSVFSIAAITHIKRKSGAQVGDTLILTKPLGNGIAIAARQQGRLGDKEYAEALKVLRESNRAGSRLGYLAGVSAMTDITGFGLLGHMSEMAEASGVTLCLKAHKVPLLPGIASAARDGAFPVLCELNLETYESKIKFHKSLRHYERLALNDPQTNGGLLISVRPDAKEEVFAELNASGSNAFIIGEIAARRPDGILIDVAN